MTFHRSSLSITTVKNLYITFFLASILGLAAVPGIKAEDKPVLSQEQSDAKFTELVLKGFDRENANDFQAALDLYARALEFKSDSAAIQIRKAYVEARLGQYARTAHDLKAATSIQPVSLTDYLTAAWMRATCPFPSLRDGALAVAYAQKALREQPSPEAYDMLAAGYAEMGNYTKAGENIRAALKLFPDSTRIPALKERLALYQSHKPWREVWGGDEKKQEKEMRGN